MKSKLAFSLALFVLTGVLSAAASAQSAPAAPQGLTPLPALLQRADVVRDLNLSSTEKSAVDKFVQSQQATPPAAPVAPGAPSPFPPQAPTPTPEQVAASNKAAEATLADGSVISNSKFQRLKQIQIQIAGNSAILDAAVQTRLGLTDAQKQRIADLVKANAANTQQPQNAALMNPDALKNLESNARAFSDGLAAVLTDQNKSDLKTMGGAAFTADPPSTPVGPSAFPGLGA